MTKTLPFPIGLVLVLAAVGCHLDPKGKTSCQSQSDCSNGYVCQQQSCVATMMIDGMVESEVPRFIDAAFAPETSCGILIAFSGMSLAKCTDGELRKQTNEPYLLLDVADSTAGTYPLTHPGAHCLDRGMEATFDGSNTNTDDAVSGTLEIQSSSATELTGALDISFGTGDSRTPAGRLQGTFRAHACR